MLPLSSRLPVFAAPRRSRAPVARRSPPPATSFAARKAAAARRSSHIEGQTR